jgi:hypothetical protein
LVTKKKNTKKEQYLPNQKALFTVLARIRLRMNQDQREVKSESGEINIKPNQPTTGLPYIASPNKL